jgi:outer membrane protein OmpA-like peptidoglycan-associated protein
MHQLSFFKRASKRVHYLGTHCLCAHVMLAVAGLMAHFAVAKAQDSASQRSLMRLGVFGQGTLSWHSAQFIGLQSATNTYLLEPYFTKYPLPLMLQTANPITWNAGFLAEAPIIEIVNGSSLGLAARIGASSFAAAFASTTPYPFGGSPSDNSRFDFTLTTDALFLNAEPLVQWRFGNNRFALMAGMRFGTVIGETTVQRREFEASVSPDLLKRLKDLWNREDAGQLSGSTAFASSIAASLVGGVSWEVPLTANGAVLLTPEVFYTLGLGNVSTNLFAQTNQTAFWSVSTLRAGLALKFAPEKPVFPPPSDGTQGSSIAQESGNQASGNQAANAQSSLSVRILSVAGVERDGRRVENPTVKVEEFIASSSRYLLPFVFFGEKSAILPDRYIRFRTSNPTTFAPDSVLRSTFAPRHELDAYYQILNIVGYRLKNTPAANLTLTGYNDAGSENADKTDNTLALRRAEAIKTYLSAVWGIAPNRIATKSGGTHGTAETVDAEENRAVELQASTPEILDELRYDYTAREVLPPKLEIEPEITAPQGLIAWSMAVDGQAPEQALKQAPVRLADFNGTISPKVITWGVERVISLTPLSPMPIAPKPLSLLLRAADKARQSSEASVSIPLEILTIAEKQRRNMPDVRIGTYWVFCFDLNSRQILVDERIRRAIRSIKTHITPGASVEITGYADTRGNVEKNRKLSDDRAEAVLQLINVPLSKIANVEGKGESTIYDNDLPEGRLYNRFVRVDVRTPLERKR